MNTVTGSAVIVILFVFVIYDQRKVYDEKRMKIDHFTFLDSVTETEIEYWRYKNNEFLDNNKCPQKTISVKSLYRIKSYMILYSKNDISSLKYWAAGPGNGCNNVPFYHIFRLRHPDDSFLYSLPCLELPQNTKSKAQYWFCSPYQREREEILKDLDREDPETSYIKIYRLFM